MVLTDGPWHWSEPIITVSATIVKDTPESRVADSESTRTLAHNGGSQRYLCPS